MKEIKPVIRRGMKAKVMIRLASLVMTMLFFGCAQKASLSNANVAESLHTEIRPDGSKIFEYSTYLIAAPKSIQGTLSKKVQRVIATQQGNRTSTRIDKTSQRDLSKALAQHFQQRLTNLEILELFCREGYFVLEEFDSANEKRLKAECHDSATPADYQRFKSAS